MRPSWELQRLYRGDWAFTIEDAPTIRRRLLRREPPSVPARADPARPQRELPVASGTGRRRLTSRYLGSIEALRAVGTLASMSMLAAAAAVLTITVRVYDLYGLPPDERAKALAFAAETLAQATMHTGLMLPRRAWRRAAAVPAGAQDPARWSAVPGPTERGATSSARPSCRRTA